MAEGLHDFSRLRPVGLAAAVARQRRDHFGRHAPVALGRRQHDAADLRLALGQDADERLAIERQRQRRSDLWIVERRGIAVHDQIGGVVGRLQLANRVRQLGLDVLYQRDRQIERERHVELAGDERQYPGRPVGDDAPVDGIEIRTAFAPVIRVAHELHGFVALELHELERAGADRLRAHVLSGYVTRIDRCVAGGEQRQERGLRASEHNAHGIVALGLARVSELAR